MIPLKKISRGGDVALRREFGRLDARFRHRSRIVRARRVQPTIGIPIKLLIELPVELRGDVAYAPFRGGRECTRGIVLPRGPFDLDFGKIEFNMGPVLLYREKQASLPYQKMHCIAVKASGRGIVRGDRCVPKTPCTVRFVPQYGILLLALGDKGARGPDPVTEFV